MVDENVEIPGVVKKGQLLTLSTGEAVRLKFAKAQVADEASLLRAVGLPGAQVVTSTGSGSTLVISGPTPEDLSDPLNPNHDHGAAPAMAPTTRDTATLERVARFVAATP